jgi:predicted nucleic acid-binding protein
VPPAEQAEDLLRRYREQDFSFTEAVSFAVMGQRGISEAFAFDRHFLTAGFILLPAPSP